MWFNLIKSVNDSCLWKCLMDMEDNLMKHSTHISSINVRNRVPVISDYCCFC